jgi:hypothetical protein
VTFRVEGEDGKGYRHVYALQGGKKVGVLEWDFVRDGAALAHLAFVGVTARLRRQGIGEELVRRFKQEARRLGVRTVSADLTWIGAARLLARVLGRPRSIGDAVRDYTAAEVRRYLPDRTPFKRGRMEDGISLEAYYNLPRAPWWEVDDLATDPRRNPAGTPPAARPSGRRGGRAAPPFTLPAFLQSDDAALAWARAHDVDLIDSEELEDEDHDALLEERAGEFSDRAREIGRDGGADIYRAIEVPKVADPTSVTDLACVGSAWSVERGRAAVQWGGGWKGPTERILLVGHVDARHVDWPAALAVYIGMGEDEWELRLKKRVPVWITEIEREDGRVMVFDPPLAANTGSAGGGWGGSECAKRWQARVMRRLVRQGKAGAR